jgi:hypothetical protein
MSNQLKDAGKKKMNISLSNASKQTDKKSMEKMQT